MSDFDDVTTYDEPAVPEAEAELFVDEPADSGWSPVMGTPPPDFQDTAPADLLDAPPHEHADTHLPPPAPEPVDGLDTAPPPPPGTGELPPELPADELDPVDLSGGVDLGGPPMPPVAGETDVPPPAGADEIDLGAAPPVAPDVSPVAGDGELQSPVPPMGDLQSPVPPMGDAPTGTSTEQLPADGIDLGDGGPPMPPGIAEADGDTAPPVFDPADGGPIELPTEPGDPLSADPLTGDPLTGDPLTGDPLTGDPLLGEPAPTDPDLETVLSVNPGDERVAAAAVAGVLLDQMDYDDPARERMIELLEQYADDGTITVAEVEEAFVRSGMASTTVDGTEDQLLEVLDSGDGAGRAAVVGVPDEGVGVFRARHEGGVVELESMRTGAVYAAQPAEVARAWRDSGSTLFTSPAPVVAPALPSEPIAAADPAPTDDEAADSGGLRNVFLAGAVLLPLAGGATYLATKKIR